MLVHKINVDRLPVDGAEQPFDIHPNELQEFALSHYRSLYLPSPRRSQPPPQCGTPELAP